MEGAFEPFATTGRPPLAKQLFDGFEGFDVEEGV